MYSFLTLQTRSFLSKKSWEKLVLFFSASIQQQENRISLALLWGAQGFVFFIGFFFCVAADAELTRRPRWVGTLNGELKTEGTTAVHVLFLPNKKTHTTLLKDEHCSVSLTDLRNSVVRLAIFGPGL